ncbi:MAG: right-handed parallel beta-helix repeat-containing protein, partial [Nocardioidaceae bacterium]
DFPGVQMGICVVPADINFNDGSYTHRIQDVAISGFKVMGFSGFGVFAYGSLTFKVSHVQAVNNGVYGIARFDGIGGWITDSAASGSDEAGIYVGDSPNAHALVRDNQSWGNGLGIFVRHTHKVTVRDNWVQGNCVGVLLLDDGQPEGSGDNWVQNNSVRNNNKFCPASDEAPALSGGGILLLGSQSNHIIGNSVTDNHHAGTLASGGIVLLTSPDSMKGSSHNWIRGNRLDNNRPVGIRQDKGSVDNHYSNNICRTSRPAWICAG